MSVLAVDVSRYQSLRERAQKEADRIALQAVRALPDRELAREIVQKSLSALPDLELAQSPSGDSSLLIDDSSITLTVSGSSEAVFDAFLPKEHFFNVQEIATAARVPQDVVLILADGHTLRPPARVNWGDATEWPASGYFRFVSNPNPRGLPEVGAAEEGVYWPQWWREWETELFQRWATQSCFNPNFTSLKLAAISYLDRLSAVKTNRVALFFAPGDDARLGYAVARSLSLFQPEQAEARWFSMMELPTYFGDETCLLFAHSETSADSRYHLPVQAKSLLPMTATTPGCNEVFRTTGWGSLWFPNGHLEECFTTERLRLRESVYYRASRSTELPADASHIFSALEEAISELAREATLEQNRVRGNLFLTPLRQIFVLSDSLPRADGERFQGILSQLQSLRAQVVLVSFRHTGLSAFRQERLQDAEASFETLNSEVFRLIKVQQPSQLLSGELMAQLQRSEEYVLRR